MESRILKTRFWRDDKIQKLSPNARYLYVYLLTCPYIGLTPYFELPNAYIQIETGLSNEEIEKAKKELEKLGRVYFFESWIYIPRVDLHNRYNTGEKTSKGYQKELSNIPQYVLDYFKNLLDTGIKGVSRYPDTPRNKKSEIINQKLENIGDEDVKEKGEKLQKNDGEKKEKLDLADGKGLTSSVGSLLKERLEKIKTNAEKKSGIYTAWQDKAFRYAVGLKIKLTKEYKARWFRVFKLASEGKNSKNLELAYSYLSDYPRELSNEAKIKFFFWIYEHGLPKTKLGFVSTKILVILGIFTLLLTLGFYLLYRIDKFFEKYDLEFKPPVVVKIQKPIEVVEKKEKIVYIREFIESLPKPQTPIEKYICEKFGSDCQIALAVAKAESGLREEAININSNGTIDMGLFQINSIHWKKPGCNPKALLDGYKNTDCAYQIWKAQGWNPWVTYQNGRWLIVNSNK